MSRNMAALSELAMSTLVARGVALHQARVSVLTVERVRIGFALEEQARPPDVEGFDLAEYTAAYPTVPRHHGVLQTGPHGRRPVPGVRDPGRRRRSVTGSAGGA
jgi:hypothetical protein